MTSTEGGSHPAGHADRLSTTGDDVVNQRQSFRKNRSVSKTGMTDKPTVVKGGGCFGFCKPKPPVEEVDVVLVGGGVMSATVGLMLKQLEPSWKIVIYERLGAMAEESSNGWNNAGTGHSALCEPNYTPGNAEKVDVSKAITVNENWQLSRQYWTYLKNQNLLKDPNTFIDVTPHCTFAYGEDQVGWLKQRYNSLHKHPLFEGMEYTDDPKTLREWSPLMMEGRSSSDKVALSRCKVGTDVDFGELTRNLGKAFMKLGGNLLLFHTVSGLKKEKDGKWLVTVKKNDLGAKTCQVRSKFVFVGAGGWALLLLQKSKIPEIRGFMGFPISGEFLVCQNPDVVSKHPNKVYGKAAIGAPPMSVPHLDKRIIGGKHMILFGPFAGFSPRYLKTGSLMDLFKSIRLHNLIPAAAAGLQNLDLTVYLMKQLLASDNAKFAELQNFVPSAKPQDWLKVTAGQRVQIMKKDPKKVGILQFGTEVVAASDGSICGLLGASPGASTAVQVALDVLTKCFGNTHMKKWEPTLKTMIKSYGTKLSDNKALYQSIHAETAAALNIK